MPKYFQISCTVIDDIFLYIHIGLDNKIFQRTNVNIFLPINFNIGFGCSKEPSHRDSSFEYPQHMFG